MGMCHVQSFNASLSLPWGSPATNSLTKWKCLPAPSQNWRWRFNPWHLCRVSGRMLPTLPSARPPAQQDRDGGDPSAEQLLAKSLPGISWDGNWASSVQEEPVGPRNLAAGWPQVTSNPGHTWERAGIQAVQELSHPHHFRCSWIYVVSKLGWTQRETFMNWCTRNSQSAKSSNESHTMLLSEPAACTQTLSTATLLHNQHTGPRPYSKF